MVVELYACSPTICQARDLHPKHNISMAVFSQEAYP